MMLGVLLPAILTFSSYFQPVLCTNSLLKSRDVEQKAESTAASLSEGEKISGTRVVNRYFSFKFSKDFLSGDVKFYEKVVVSANSVEKEIFMYSKSFLDCLVFPFLVAALSPHVLCDGGDLQREYNDKVQVFRSLLSLLQNLFSSGRPLGHLISINCNSFNQKASAYFFLLFLIFVGSLQERHKLKCAEITKKALEVLASHCIQSNREFYRLTNEICTLLQQKTELRLPKTQECEPESSCFDAFVIKLVYHELFIIKSKAPLFQALWDLMTVGYETSIGHFSKFYQQTFFEIATNFADSLRIESNHKISTEIFKQFFVLIRVVPKVSYDSLTLISFDKLLDFTKDADKMLKSHNIDKLKSTPIVKLDSFVMRLLEFLFVHFKLQVKIEGDGKSEHPARWEGQCKRFFENFLSLHDFKVKLNVKYCQLNNNGSLVQCNALTCSPSSFQTNAQMKDAWHDVSMLFESDHEIQNCKFNIDFQYSSSTIVKYVKMFQTMLSGSQANIRTTSDCQPPCKKRKIFPKPENAPLVGDTQRQTRIFEEQWFQRSPFSIEKFVSGLNVSGHKRLQQFIYHYFGLRRLIKGCRDSSNTGKFVPFLDYFFSKHSEHFVYSKPIESWNGMWASLNASEKCIFLEIYAHHLIHRYKADLVENKD